jgi:hypothetical protein
LVVYNQARSNTLSDWLKAYDLELTARASPLYFNLFS